jgi:Ubiquitin family
MPSPKFNLFTLQPPSTNLDTAIRKFRKLKSSKSSATQTFRPSVAGLCFLQVLVNPARKEAAALVAIMSDQLSSGRSGGSAERHDTIILHVLSPSPEVNGGRITFPSIPLDTDILHLKSRIQNSMTVPMPLERQRLIYRGRPVLNMHSTLRQILQSEASLLPLLASYGEKPGALAD